MCVGFLGVGFSLAVGGRRGRRRRVTRQEKENPGFMSSLMRSMKRCSMSGDLTGPCLKFHALLATQPATESGQLIQKSCMLRYST